MTAVAISSYANFFGSGKETTYGTPVSPTLYTPSTEISFVDVPNYVPNNPLIGSAVDMTDMIPTQPWGTFSYGSPVYMDVIGQALKAIFGAEDLSGSGPYVHAFSVNNAVASQLQPPSWSLVDYTGVEALRYPGALYSQVELTFAAGALLSGTYQGMSQQGVAFTKPTQSFSAKRAMAAYLGVITIGGSANATVESGTVTITRQVNPIPLINAGSAPMWAGSLGVAGSLTMLYVDDTIRTPMLAGTPTALDLSFTNGADILELQSTSTRITGSPITPNSNGYMEQTVAFSAVGNTTDVTTAGAGYSPMIATLTNTVSTAY